MDYVNIPPTTGGIKFTRLELPACLAPSLHDDGSEEWGWLIESWNYDERAEDFGVVTARSDTPQFGGIIGRSGDVLGISAGQPAWQAMQSMGTLQVNLSEEQTKQLAEQIARAMGGQVTYQRPGGRPIKVT